MGFPHYQGLAHYGIAGIAFQWLIFTFVLIRVSRFVTDDDFPPMAWLREKIQNALLGKWSILIVCGWCVSIYLGTLLYWVSCHMLDIPLPVAQAGASMAVTGLSARLWE